MELKDTCTKMVMKLRDFLLSRMSRELFVFLFFFLVAAAFWLVQTLDGEYEIELKLPVKLVDVPENIVITTEPVEEVIVRVRDEGTVLLGYQLGSAFAPINIHFADHKGGRHSHVSLLSSQFLRSVEAQLSPTTRILSLKPDTLEYYYSQGRSKKVPVRLDGRVGAATQYYLSDTIFRPDSVLVYSTLAGLDTIHVARTEFVEYSHIKDTLNETVPLLRTPGVKFVPSEVQLVLPVDIYTEKTVEVPIEAVHFPADKVLRTFPSKVKITFQVGLGNYLKVRESDFRVVVDYNELVKVGEGNYPVQLQEMPQSIRQVRMKPTHVDFLIEQIAEP